MDITAPHELLHVSKVSVDETIEACLPQISQAQYTALHSSIETLGQREPLVLWDSTVIDGHNRLRVLTSLGRDALVTRLDVEKYTECLRQQGLLVDDMTERDIVMHWIYESQCARRNASRWTRCVAQMANESTIPKGEAAKQIAKMLGIKKHYSADISAARAGVSTTTYRKAQAIDKGFRDKIIPLIARKQLDNEDVSISAVYRLLLREQDMLEIKRNVDRTRVPLVGKPPKRTGKKLTVAEVNHSPEGVGIATMKKLSRLALDESDKVCYNINMHLHIFEAVGKSALVEPVERLEMRNSVKRLKKAAEDVAKALKIR